MGLHISGGDMRVASSFSSISCAAFLWVFSGSESGAQVYGTDYIVFKGEGTILDNPTSPECQALNLGFGGRFTVTYRFSANPAAIADAIIFQTEAQTLIRIISTSASKSLNGASTFDWINIHRHAHFSSGSGSSNLTIATGLNLPVSLAAGNIKITNGQINNFYANGCSIANFRAAMVVLPNF